MCDRRGPKYGNDEGRRQNKQSFGRDEDHEPTGHCPHTSVQYEKKGGKNLRPCIYKKNKKQKEEEKANNLCKTRSTAPAKFRGRCRFMEIFCKVCR